MNKETIKENVGALLEYLAEPGGAHPKKLTVILPNSYQELLKRTSILTGQTKTRVVIAALDAYAEQFGEGLFPHGP